MGIIDKITSTFRSEPKKSMSTYDGFNTNDNSEGLNVPSERWAQKYVQFGDNNQYPNYLNNLYNSSGLHSAIVNFTKNLTVGGGYTINGASKMSPVKTLEMKQFFDLTDGKQSLEEVLDQSVLDLILHGTLYFKVFWNSDKTRIIKLVRIEPSKIRVMSTKQEPEVITGYVYNFDWENPGTYGTSTYPPYNPFEKNDNRIEIFRYIQPNNAMLFNTLPAYAAGVNWIDLDGGVSTFHKANLHNSINPSLTIKFYQKPANEEEKRMIVNGINKQYGGVEKTGKVMVFFSDDKDTAPDVQPIEVSNIDKQFSVTADSIQRNICYAHSVDPQILGLKTPGSLGNSGELEVAFEMYKQGKVRPLQRDVEKLMNKFLKLNGLPVTISLNEVDIDIKTTTTNG